MARIILTFAFLISVTAKGDDQNGLITALEDKLENKLVFYANNFAKWLENVNDRHLGQSELGKMLDYNGIKPKFNNIGSESRGMKKMAMVLLPIIFHVGATSTWLILTALMAAKSVAIGIILLVFKIAVSSAKVAAFFTAWKHKNQNQEHSWSPHYEHGHYRSIHDAGTHSDSPYLSYNPGWNTEQKTLSTSFIPEPYHEIDLKHSIDKKS
ncbi:uncharacterized protein LOC120625395 [Pararge aegeria]|uniref:Jg4889 protein n=1 Tax=Pararge aegeria aegeria TaxID=348720 RepID=A0A8S4RM41_9NEOP|nr:uncharacterized protein LOC120625395 [Pararge aegeria]CAH2237877.1 jg4889 [Pararge aegeria aegeria]